MEKGPKYTPPQVPYTAPKAPTPQVKHYQMYESDDYESKTMVSVKYTKETVKKYVGTWVHCHSMYGLHEGVVHRALRDGIILVHHTQLSDGTKFNEDDFKHGVFESGSDEEFCEAQFFLPFPGMFVPYGGMFGLYPRPFIW